MIARAKERRRNAADPLEHEAPDEKRHDEDLLSLARMARRAGVNPYSTLLAAFDAEMRIRDSFPTWPDCDLAEVLRAVPEALEAPSWRDQLERHREAYAQTFIGWKRSTPDQRSKGAKLLEPLTTASDSERESHLRRELAGVARLLCEPLRDCARIARTLEKALAFLIPAEARRLKKAGDPRGLEDIRADLRHRHGLGTVTDESMKKRRQRARKAGAGGQASARANVPSRETSSGPTFAPDETAATPRRTKGGNDGRKADEHGGPRRGAPREGGDRPEDALGRKRPALHPEGKEGLVRPFRRAGLDRKPEAAIDVRAGAEGRVTKGKKRRPPP